jgi:proline iminopeptidase
MRTFERLPASIQKLATSAVGTYAAYVAYGLGHPRLLRGQVTSAERAAALPGDELVGDADWITDVATSIAAAPAAIWPWLVQMGYGRAGWYGWYPFENGGHGSASEIIESLQHLAIGDVLPDGPRAAEGFGVWRVERLEPTRALVLYSRRELTTGLEVGPAATSMYVACSWAFVLVPQDGELTRLHVRVRARVHAGRRGRLVVRAARSLLGAGDTVMENTMVEGIRRRAEQSGSITERLRALH